MLLIIGDDHYSLGLHERNPSKLLAWLTTNISNTYLYTNRFTISEVNVSCKCDMQMCHLCLCYGLVAMKEYDRVVGWEGSDAVSPPRDGIAWALRSCSTTFLRG